MSILVPIAVNELNRGLTSSQFFDFQQRVGSIVGVDKIDKLARCQFGSCITENSLEVCVKAIEIPVSVGNAE